MTDTPPKIKKEYIDKDDLETNAQISPNRDIQFPEFPQISQFSPENQLFEENHLDNNNFQLASQLQKALNDEFANFQSPENDEILTFDLHSLTPNSIYSKKSNIKPSHATDEILNFHHLYRTTKSYQNGSVQLSTIDCKTCKRQISQCKCIIRPYVQSKKLNYGTVRTILHFCENCTF